jgi:hypothetical protein
MRARTSLLRLLPVLLLPLAAPLACGGGGPEPQTATTKPVASVTTVASVQEVALTPIEAPEGLAVAIRMKSPSAVSSSVLQLVPAWKDFELGRMLRDLLDDEALVALVDPDKPMDMALVERPRVNNPNAYDRGEWFGFAMALRDDADFGGLQGRFKLVGGANGVQYLVREGKEGQWFHACAVAPSLGASKRRLVCAEEHERRHLDGLLPWLTRGAPTKAYADDVHVELFAAPFKKKFENDLRDGRDEAESGVAGMIKTDHPEIDRVLKKAAKGFVGEAFAFVDDVDRGSLGVVFGPKGPELRVDATVSGATSWISKSLLAGADVTTPVPAAFGKLPVDRAGIAAFVRATPQTDALMQPIQTFTGELVEAAAVDFKWSKADRDLALATVRLMFPKATDAFVVSGRGDARAAAQTKPTAKAAPKKGKVDVDEDRDDLGTFEQLREGIERPTWSMAVLDRPIEPSVELTKSWVALLAKPAIANAVKLLSDGMLDLKVTTKPMPAKELKDFPKGTFGQTVAIDVTLFKVKDKKRGKERGKVRVVTEELLVPEGNHVWTAAGYNLAPGELVRRVQDALAGKGATVSTLPAFAAVTTGTPAWGAILRIGEFARQIAPSGETQKTEEILASLPDKGDGAIAARSSATRAGSGGTAQLFVMLPRDLFAGVHQLMKRQP